MAGNSIGDGLVIDTSRHFNRVLSIDPQAETADIEPGVICDDLRAAAAEHGLTYGPDPSTHARCTVGGMVGNNACGSHSVAWGTAAENLVAVTVMLADGREVELRAGGTSGTALTRALSALRDEHRAMLRTELGQFPRQVSGYGLHYLLEENGFDVAKAFAGTEGTCGIITRMTVKLVRRPAATALAVLSFADAIAAAHAAPALRVRGVTTNIPFLMNVLDDPQFLAGDVATDFIDAHPELAAVNRSQDRGSKALQYLVDVTVNQPHGPRIEGIDPRDRLPEHPGYPVLEAQLLSSLAHPV